MHASTVFRRDRTIGEREIDELGHVNNVVWVRLVMELAGAHSQSVGLSFAAYREIGGIFVVRRHELDYLLPAFPGDDVYGETWVAELRGARSIRHSRFTRNRDGARLLESVTQWAFVDLTTQRPRRIPPRVLEAFEHAKA